MKVLSKGEKKYPVVSLCEVAGFSKQTYYKWKEVLYYRMLRERFVVEYVKGERERQKSLGGEKLWHKYRAYFGEENSLGRDAFMSVLSRYGLLLRRRRRRVRTTDARHGYPLYPNLIREKVPERVNQIWVSDITYIRTQEGFSYLSLVTDAYSRQIIGWHLASEMEARHSVEALRMATSRFQEEELKGLIHHSDRGSQYASSIYTGQLAQHRIRISMSESGDPKENAIAERVNGIIKHEYLYHHRLENRAQAYRAVEEAVDLYNRSRPHRSLDMKTPEQAALASGKLKKRWKSYKDIYLNGGKG